MKRFFYLVIILLAYNLYSQQNNTSKIKDSLRVGFNCSIDANKKSNFVKEYEKKFIKISNLNELKKDLKYEGVKQISKNFLALIICETLEKRNLIILDEKDKKHIKILYERSLPLFICEFCFLDTTYSNILLNNDKNSITQSARNWAKNLIDNRVEKK